jgi:hypothetical protein
MARPFVGIRRAPLPCRACPRATPHTVDAERTVSPGRLKRLAEELAEADLGLLDAATAPELLLDELDYALRPPTHERRVPTYGAIVDPVTDPATWASGTALTVMSRTTGDLDDEVARRFADGLSSWAVRRLDGVNELVVFDRPASSERDLVVLAEATRSTVVQRHPTGVVRVVGTMGVARWDGMAWHREPPLESWIDPERACIEPSQRTVVSDLLSFAVHDLGARGIGALLVHRNAGDPPPQWEMRLAEPPALRIGHAFDLAPLRHVLSQLDGAAVFDSTGTLRHLGVRLVPSATAEANVEPYRGTRHTAARRYSYDDPSATVIVVSEDGPVTALRNGEIIGRSNPT